MSGRTTEIIEIDAIEGRRSLALTDGLIWDRMSARDESTSRHRELIDLTPAHLDRYPFTNLADVSSGPALRHSPSGQGGERSESQLGTDTGFYWQIPRSGGTTLKHLFGSCLDRVQASRVSKDHCDTENSRDLEICNTRFGRFVNADPSDDPGILRAGKMGLVPSGLAHVVVSSRFLHAATLFDELPGRAFTVFRHPVERAASTFFYLRDATWERTYNPEFKTMSLVEYAARPDTPHDWMVRWLTGKNHEELTPADLDFAKALLRRKFFVMLTDDMPTSIDRLVRYMGWDDVTSEMKKCARDAASKEMGKNGHEHRRIAPGTEEYRALRDINLMDVELYDYAVNELMHEQWVFVYSGVGVTAEEEGKEEEENRDPDLTEDANAENDRYRREKANKTSKPEVARPVHMTQEQMTYLEKFNTGSGEAK